VVLNRFGKHFIFFSFDLKIPKIIDDEILPVPINPKIMNDAE